jgi:hypothetical protein
MITSWGCPPIETTQKPSVRDTTLHAIGVGAGSASAVDPEELQYVYENGLKAVPTMAVVMAYPGFWAKDPKYGLTWQKILHGQQLIELHRPLPVEGLLKRVTRIDVWAGTRARFPLAPARRAAV